MAIYKIINSLLAVSAASDADFPNTSEQSPNLRGFADYDDVSETRILQDGAGLRKVRAKHRVEIKRLNDELTKLNVLNGKLNVELIRAAIRAAIDRDVEINGQIFPRAAIRAAIDRDGAANVELNGQIFIDDGEVDAFDELTKFLEALEARLGLEADLSLAEIRTFRNEIHALVESRNGLETAFRLVERSTRNGEAIARNGEAKLQEEATKLQEDSVTCREFLKSDCIGSDVKRICPFLCADASDAGQSQS